MSRGDRSRPGRERSAEERERDRQERARQRAQRAGNQAAEQPPATSPQELRHEHEPVADDPPPVPFVAAEPADAPPPAVVVEPEPAPIPFVASELVLQPAEAPSAETSSSEDPTAQLPPPELQPEPPAAPDRSSPAVVGEPEPAADVGSERASAASEPLPIAQLAPPLPPPSPSTRTRAPERSIPPATSRRRSRSWLARLAALFALAAVAAALLLLFHSLRSKPAAKVTTPTVVKVVIPEGKTRAQIAQIASAAGLTGSYPAASRHSPLLNPAHYGAPHGTENLEGFLFPATYDMDSGASVGRLVQEQLIAFRENFGAQELARARSLHITPYELLIIASMVEREAQVSGDRSKIAAVIYNRLREGMPLGIDATIYYAVELAKGIPTYTHELSETQLHIDSPYNTRTHTGLPPTPIANPGLASIHAAAHPAHVSYLYYVAGADGCGEQVFSNTLAEFEVHSAAYKAAVEKNGGHPPSCKRTLTGTPSGAHPKGHRQAGK